MFSQKACAVEFLQEKREERCKTGRREDRDLPQQHRGNGEGFTSSGLMQTKRKTKKCQVKAVKNSRKSFPQHNVDEKDEEK